MRESTGSLQRLKMEESTYMTVLRDSVKVT
jgi:hypothetical protein